MEEKDNPGEAVRLFQQAWDDATNDFEKFLAAYYLSRHQDTVPKQLYWLETTLQFALKTNTDAVNSALPSLYQRIAQSYEVLGNPEAARKYSEQSMSNQFNPPDKGPFYHGTKADLKTGDLLIAGGHSNYQSELKMNHIYFTALVNGAGLAAALARGEGAERVYMVEPTGSFENDPNLTDKKFPGNPTRSYRSEAPLKIVGEVREWTRPDPESLKRFREKVENNKGEIIN